MAMRWRGLTVLTAVNINLPKEINNENGKDSTFWYPVYFAHGEDVDRISVPEDIYNCLSLYHTYVVAFEVIPPYSKDGRTSYKVTKILAEVQPDVTDDNLEAIIKNNLVVVPFDDPESFLDDVNKDSQSSNSSAASKDKKSK